MIDQRAQFASTAVDLVDTDPDTALVYAEIAGQYLGEVTRRHPERVINVGIREQLLVDVGAGLSLGGMFPIVHTFAPFLVERAYEQIKLGFGHQDVDGLLISTGGSVDMPGAGRTHQTDADVMLMAAVPGFSVHVPGTAREVDELMRLAHATGGRHYIRATAQSNHDSHPVVDGRLQVIRRGASGLTVLAVGPMLDPVLAATADIDATVCYTATVRPFDSAGLRAVATITPGRVPDVVLVEPYLAGTSAHEVTAALVGLPHHLLSLGFARTERRHYGCAADHLAAAGLDAEALALSIQTRHSPRTTGDGIR